MEASPEDGSTIMNIKQEEPDSSERDAESPDDGQALVIPNGDSRRESTEEEEIYIKHEPFSEDQVSLSPANSDADRQSGSGGEDNRDPLGRVINRRKRKVPVKYQQSPAPNDMSVYEIHTPPKKKSAVNYDQNQALKSQPSEKHFSVMTKERARNQAINSMPRSTCPICGDKANGLHYGIYTCEACKNFFKRSVAIDTSKVYICKFNNSCNVNITEVDGIKLKGPRCQSCRYQACLDAGMYHSGIQRTRGGRHGYSPVKQRSNSVEKYPTIQLPNISAVMSAAVASSKPSDEQQSANMEPADIVSVSMSPPSSDHNESTETEGTPQHYQQTPSFLSKNQIWEQFVNENVQNEVDLLKSRAAIAENLLAEKTKQLDIVQRQVALLKQHLIQADQLNKEQAITIESLKRRLNHNNTNGTKQNGNSKEGLGNSSATTIERVTKNDSVKLSSMVFENGGVTITPVVSSNSMTSTNNSSISKQDLNHPGSQNLLSHLLRDAGNNGTHKKLDLATIEPIRESRNKS